jgi:hypothetical protein
MVLCDGCYQFDQRDNRLPTEEIEKRKRGMQIKLGDRDYNDNHMEYVKKLIQNFKSDQHKDLCDEFTKEVIETDEANDHYYVYIYYIRADENSKLENTTTLH